MFNMGNAILKKIKKPSAMIQINAKALTLTQRKIINFIICIIQQTGEQPMYNTNIAFLKKLCNIKKTENINLKYQFKELEEITIEFNYLKKDDELWESIKLISAVRFYKNSGIIEFEIPYMLKEKILKPNIYVPLNIVLIAGLKSKYAIVLYELFRDYKNAPNFPRLTIRQLRNLLGLNESKYKEFQNFKKRVLNSAINEINEKTDIFCFYELVKKGRKYIGINFKIKKNNKNDFKKINQLKKGDNNKLLPFGNTKKIPSEILKILPEKYQIESVYNLIVPHFDSTEYLISNIKYSNKHCKENYPAYLKLALKNDYAKAEREVKEKKNNIIQKKKDHIKEKKYQEKLLKQKAWDYFNSLPETKQFELKSEAKEKMSAALKLFKTSERKKDIINAQIEKDLTEVLKEKNGYKI